ncbi:hypothetical protein V1521DRAFT_244666 [Lipomyces starkeyi]
MVTPLRSRLETTTIGLAQTVRSWLKAGVIHDRVMDVPDLDTLTRLETTTIGLAQTVRSWLKAGVIHDRVMDVPDLDTLNHREERSDPVKNDFNEESDDDTGAVSLLEDGKGDGDSEVVTLYD